MDLRVFLFLRLVEQPGEDGALLSEELEELEELVEVLELLLDEGLS